MEYSGGGIIGNTAFASGNITTEIITASSLTIPETTTFFIRLTTFSITEPAARNRSARDGLARNAI
jgi:hypothetical protein